MKTCKICGEVKPLEAFAPHKDCRDGRRNTCSACHAKALAAYYQTRKARPGMRDRMKATEAAYHKKSVRPTIRHAIANALRRRPNDNPVTVDQAMEIWHRQRGLCALSGIPMTWASGARQPLSTSVSIDRIDQSGGYATSNIRFLCQAVNAFRGIMSDADMDVMLRRFSDYRLAGPWVLLSEVA